MIEAKGPGYAWRLKAGKKFEEEMRDEVMKQANRHVGAAPSRDTEWFFAEPEAAEAVRQWFEADERFKRIKIFVVPPELW
ncbi:hypothetical protein [Methylocystis heyeri]|uniref:Tox-REase-5 domain-containing protein n=1 Tax=Methylocystis heyeri TaxID=391905 RepID=A0A6B8KKU6_9HYPH|nr:hypothetical protein [Methylocystis heyeri]QGM47318.1 hypothetical protein H2LOC_017385 [Methylocystis heyeri]